MSKNGRVTVEELLNRIGQVHEKATVKTVFGEPMQVDGRTIVPVARVRYVFGLGMGRGNVDSKDGPSAGGGEGGGGGGGVTVRPIAVLEVSGQETKVKPIPDVTRLALAGIALVAWNVFWITATIRAVAKARAAR